MVAVILALVVAAKSRPQLVSGVPHAVPVSAPPQVGTCVLDPIGSSTTDGYFSTSAYPRQRLEPCHGPRYGEVAQVIADPPKVSSATANTPVIDTNLATCYSSADRYLGAQLIGLDSLWSPNLIFNSDISRPSTRQEADGQHWVACLVSLQPIHSVPRVRGSKLPPAPATGEQYSGVSLRNALSTGHYRNQIGNCIPFIDWKARGAAGACASPHPLEILATGTNGDRARSREEIQTSCLSVVRRLTGIPDPSVGGQLRVTLNVTSNENVSATIDVPVHASLQCGIVAASGKMLSGSLLALGNLPIPWSP